MVCLSPSYDLLNTTLVLGNASEESALPLHGKKRNLTRKDWIDYFCRERLGLSSLVLDPILHALVSLSDAWDRKIQNSYLSHSAKDDYLKIVNERRARLFG